MTDKEALLVALEALHYCEALNRDADERKMQAITVIRELWAQPEQEPVAKYSDIVSDGGLDPRNTTPPQRTEQNFCSRCGKRTADLTTIHTCTPPQPEQEPVAKPYAYEYGRCNTDGTYSVVIEKGDLVQTMPAVYNYVRPRNAHKDWPIKELFDRPPQRKPLTNGEIYTAYITATNQTLRATDERLAFAFARAIEAAHGIKENT
jgi:hypothetical protein